GAAHAADVGDERDLLGDRGRRALGGWRRGGGQRGRRLAGARHGLRRALACRGQHFWRLPGHAADARDVPEEKEVGRPMTPNIVALLYLVSGVLFILAL